MLTFKEKYELALKNGKAEECRGDEISRRIGKKYPLSAQIAILMDSETKPEKKATYQTFRESVIDEVDAEIKTFVAALEPGKETEK